MSTTNKQRVLDEANVRFSACHHANLRPVIKDASPIIAKHLGLPAAEVTTLLRILHREKKIGLVSYQRCVSIAPDQGYLTVTRDISTSKGRAKRTVSSPSIPKPPVESVEPTEAERLQAEVDRLTQLVQGLQKSLEKSERHRNTANRERSEARESLRAARRELDTAHATVRQLEAKVAAASGAQDRIAELERLLEEQQRSGISAEVIAALTRLEASRRR